MYDEFKKVNEQSYHVNVRSGFVYNGVFPLLVLVANFGTTIVVYFGGLSVLDHRSPPATGSSSCRASASSGSPSPASPPSGASSSWASRPASASLP